MTPEFMQAIDPIIEMMVDVKEKIVKNSAPTPEAIRAAFVRRFAESEKLLGERLEEWKLARYALVGWIDEQLVSSLSWPGARFWSQNKLQVKYYRVPLARERFFQQALEAEQLAQKDVLEVYFLCVILGFQGVYNAAPGLQTPADIGLPAKIEDWIRRTREWIKVNPTKIPAAESDASGRDADPHTGKYQFLGMLLTCLIMLIVAGLVAYASLRGHRDKLVHADLIIMSCD